MVIVGTAMAGATAIRLQVWVEDDRLAMGGAYFDVPGVQHAGLDLLDRPEGRSGGQAAHHHRAADTTASGQPRALADLGRSRDFRHAALPGLVAGSWIRFAERECLGAGALALEQVEPG